MVKAFRQKSFSFKRLHYSIKNYTKTVIPYSLSQELMTAAFTAALNGIYLFIIPMGIWIGSSTINVNIKMYIFDHLRMYIFAILPLDRYIFLSDKIFL